MDEDCQGERVVHGADEHGNTSAEVEVRATWEQIYRRFDPEVPPANAAWISERPDSPIADILRDLARPFGAPRVLLGATPGTGTTTELLRLQRAASARQIVVLLDLVDHFTGQVRDLAALQRLTPQELVFLIGLKLLRAAQVHPEVQPVDPALARQLSTAWRAILAQEAGAEAPQVDVAHLLKLIASGLVEQAAGERAAQAIETAAGALQWNLRLGGSHPALDDQDRRSLELIDVVNRIAAHLSTGRDLVVLIDGLDRVDSLEAAERLFIRSQLIGLLSCALVIAAPLVFRHALPNTVTRALRFRVLHNAQVLDRHDPAAPGTAIPFFREMYRRRVADLPGGLEGLPEPVLDRLARFGGGRGRDFVRLVRELAGLAWDADVAVATDAMADQVITSLRRDVGHGLNARHIALLEQIRDDPDHKLPEDPAALDLLRYFRIMPYANGDEWYYPHPVLTLGPLTPRKPPRRTRSAPSASR